MRQDGVDGGRDDKVTQDIGKGGFKAGESDKNNQHDTKDKKPREKGKKGGGSKIGANSAPTLIDDRADINEILGNKNEDKVDNQRGVCFLLNGMNSIGKRSR